MSITECQFCGSSFNRDESQRNWKHIKFCSNDCRKGFAAQKKKTAYTPKPIMDKACLFCKKTYTPSPTQSAKQKYCRRQCMLDQRKADQHKKWIASRTTKKCAHCEADFFPNKFSRNQIYCSKGCQVKAISKRHAGKYKRSGSSLYEFNMMRPFVIDRDKVCVICESDDRLHVHHWDNSGRSNECDNSLDNLAVLCGDCHSAIHKVTLAKIDGKWCLDGRIFTKLGLFDALPISTHKSTIER